MSDQPGTFPLVNALEGALASVQIRPEDAAAVALARRYAEQVDTAPDELAKVGPLLLATLTALGMTPAGRAAVLGKGGDRNDGARKSAADELRERRAARQHAAAPVDPSAS
jgi:hypothetical protein